MSLIVRARLRIEQRCEACAKPATSPVVPVRICVDCFRPVLRGHKFTRTKALGYRHRHCRYPDSYATPEEYRAAHGETLYERMHDLLFRARR